MVNLDRTIFAYLSVTGLCVGRFERRFHVRKQHVVLGIAVDVFLENTYQLLCGGQVRLRLLIFFPF
jgi:hypothetical protein